MMHRSAKPRYAWSGVSGTRHPQRTPGYQPPLKPHAALRITDPTLPSTIANTHATRSLTRTPGRQFPLELHIVHRITDPALPACAGGCFSVLGILFELTNGPDNPNLFAILANLPLREGVGSWVVPGRASCVAEGW